jgi:hypothetical protein
MGRPSKHSIRRTGASSRTPSSSRKRVSASVLNLTEEERAIVRDPDWVTEDDADAIVCMRRDKEGSVSFEEVLRKNGIQLEH